MTMDDESTSANDHAKLREELEKNEIEVCIVKPLKCDKGNFKAHSSTSLIIGHILIA